MSTIALIFGVLCMSAMFNIGTSEATPLGSTTNDGMLVKRQSCTGDSEHVDILFLYASTFDKTYARCLNVARTKWDNLPSSVVDVDWSRCWTYSNPVRYSTDNPANGLGRCLRATENFAAARNMCNCLGGNLRTN
ncbi:hypothetical protein BGX30_005576 [Mortierella sp. GBA39]|nr:hypothetical protein BGX30_005575 [Mortierella sp. GBA39]KAF9117338.1 hypothetical protein BGX30_005576 [Mortierella sp. GBA39]